MAPQGQMILRIWDVEHGACAMLHHDLNGVAGELAMIDSGCTADWYPSTYIADELGRNRLDHLFITNADQDHMSDLQGLWDAGIEVGTFYRNRSPTPADWRRMKEVSGPLTDDAERFINTCATYVYPVPPFDQCMGGITYIGFANTYPEFTNTNDLSLAVFIKFGAFKILFPGDLEKAGWRALLQLPDFRAELAGTTILVASHHGRESGYCPDIFDYFTPRAVVISDKPIEHDTQRMVPDYRDVLSPGGVIVNTTRKTRHVLTTRRDGWIHFTVQGDGSFEIDTEYAG